MSEPAEDEWLTVPEAARRLGIGERKAYRHAAKLSDSDVKVSDSGQRLVRHSAMTCLTEGQERQTRTVGAAPGLSVIVSETVRQASDIPNEVSDRSAEPSDSDVKVSDTLLEASDNPSLPPTAEVVLLRKDLARVEDENRFMREQLALAMSGWREEQRRSREYERRMKELAAPAESPLLESALPEDRPAGAEEVKIDEARREAEPAQEAQPGVASRDGAPSSQATSGGWWTRLWGGKG